MFDLSHTLCKFYIKEEELSCERCKENSEASFEVFICIISNKECDKICSLCETQNTEACLM